MSNNYFNKNGIPTDSPSIDFWITESNHSYITNLKDNTGEIDTKLIQLTYKLADNLFGSYSNLYNILMSKTVVFSQAGIDAEIKVSKKEFEEWVNSNESEENHKLLFYYDFQSLVGSLQNLVQESKFLLCDFYKILNENTFMLDSKPIKPGIVMFASGQIVTNVFSKVNHLFINLASQLDFITKIIFEIENLPKNYKSYPKLKCNKILYGDSRKLKTIDFENTSFKRTENIKLITNLRNEIIHNASFENIPKVYQVFDENNLIEKFILIPDYTHGVFDSFKNRKRFFNNDIKLNEILPNLVTGFWDTLEKTIDKITYR